MASETLTAWKLTRTHLLSDGFSMIVQINQFRRGSSFEEQGMVPEQVFLEERRGTL